MTREAQRSTDGQARGGRRLSDHGFAGSALAWFKEWGLLVLGSWLCVVSVVLIWVAVNFAESQNRTEHNAYVACVRSQLIGPSVVKDYEDRGALPPAVLAAYKKLIPKDCGPKP